MKLQATQHWVSIYKLYDDPKNPMMFIARSYKDLVAQMRQIPFDQPKTNEQHRKLSKEFFSMWDGTILDDSSDKAFVKSLIKSGYLRHISSTPKYMTHEG
tara:strand:+ start:649 stop:948 length:300 start_codon:yes stop_codon:yes gene_type:complete